MRRLWRLRGFGLAIGVTLVAACGASPGSPEAQLDGLEWSVTVMSGFGPNNVTEGEFNFDDDRFGANDGTNSMSWEIEWTDAGFRVVEAGTSTDVGYDKKHGMLARFVEPGDEVTVTVREDGTLLLECNGRTVEADPAGEVE